MTNCTQESFQFPVLKRRIVEANFQGGDITSDGGVLLLQQVDRRLGLSEAVARTLDDPRRQASIDHNSLSLLRQRVYALALGYEDLNDHETLRLDLAIQTALGRTEELASSPTLCRMVIFSNRVAWWKDSAESPLPRPRFRTTETYDRAKRYMPRDQSVYDWENEWVQYWRDSGCPTLQSPDAAFIGFCKSRYIKLGGKVEPQKRTTR